MLNTKTDQIEPTNLLESGEIPTLRKFHCACVIDKFMVIFGGMSAGQKILDDASCLNLETFEW